jgi:AAA domain-containing protein
VDFSPKSPLNGRGHRDSQEQELGKIERMLAEMGAWGEAARAEGAPADAAALAEWFYRWQTQNEPTPFWTVAERLSLGGVEVQLGDEGQPKRLELVWDPSAESPALRVELSATRELHVALRPALPEAPDPDCVQEDEEREETAPLVIERREVDALAPLHPETGLLNMGVNRRIHRKIDSRALRIELTRSVFERLREQGVCALPGGIRRSDYYRALRELAALDPRFGGFTGLLHAHKLEELIAEAYGTEPVDELGPQLCLPVFESYLPKAVHEAAEAAQLRPGRWPTARSRPAVLQDLALWLLLQQARAMTEQNWTVPLPSEALRDDPDDPHGFQVECPLREGVPCRRGDILLVEEGSGVRLGKLVVSTVGPDELRGALRPDPEATDEQFFGHGLTLRPIRSSYGRVARSLEAMREAVGWKRDLGMSAASRACLGLEPLPVRLLEEQEVVRRLRTRSIAEDPSQLEALRWALHTQSPLVLIQGPPGTGKTTLIEEICWQAVAAGQKVAVTGPSHPAVDNALKRLCDLPLLRVAAAEENISDALRSHWTRAPGAERRFRQQASRTGGFVIGGTHIGLLNDPTIGAMSRSGLRFDLVIVDEAGMSRPEELLLSLDLAERGVLIGDQQQLPPFPVSAGEIQTLEGLLERPLLRWDRALLDESALEILVEERGFPSVLLTRNYRCQNPRLVELSSQLFYDSRVRLAPCSEYFRLPYLERQQHLGVDSLRLYDTAELPLAVRSERTEWEGGAPGYCSPLEAAIVLVELGRLLQRYPAEELCIVSPYRLQVRLLRQALERAVASDGAGRTPGLSLLQGAGLGRFVSENVTTIDGFQGRECDALLVSYVRSNRARASGFVGEPRRNNVTHTRARREMVVVGDLETLTGRSSAPDPLAERSAYVFRRMADIVRRHGVIVPLRTEAPYRAALDVVWTCLEPRELQTTAS